MDLGASPLNALRMVLLPLLTPAIVASAIVVFAISMDDFVISAYLSAGSGTDTVPVRIYSNARGAPTPALNALASLTLFVTVAAALVLFAVWIAVRRRQGAGGTAMDELARIEA
jgi:spermidine/putrescine transport system permease protein